MAHGVPAAGTASSSPSSTVSYSGLPAAGRPIRRPRCRQSASARSDRVRAFEQDRAACRWPQPMQDRIAAGTLLTREWDGQLQRVRVLADGFSWNGNTYRSLSKAAFAITGARWNGPRFFGLRDRATVGGP